MALQFSSMIFAIATWMLQCSLIKAGIVVQPLETYEQPTNYVLSPSQQYPYYADPNYRLPVYEGRIEPRYGYSHGSPTEDWRYQNYPHSYNNLYGRSPEAAPQGNPRVYSVHHFTNTPGWTNSQRPGDPSSRNTVTTATSYFWNGQAFEKVKTSEDKRPVENFLGSQQPHVYFSNAAHNQWSRSVPSKRSDSEKVRSTTATVEDDVVTQSTVEETPATGIPNLESVNEAEAKQVDPRASGFFDVRTDPPGEASTKFTIGTEKPFSGTVNVSTDRPSNLSAKVDAFPSRIIGKFQSLLKPNEPPETGASVIDGSTNTPPTEQNQGTSEPTVGLGNPQSKFLTDYQNQGGNVQLNQQQPQPAISAGHQPYIKSYQQIPSGYYGSNQAFNYQQPNQLRGSNNPLSYNPPGQQRLAGSQGQLSYYVANNSLLNTPVTYITATPQRYPILYQSQGSPYQSSQQVTIGSNNQPAHNTANRLIYADYQPQVPPDAPMQGTTGSINPLSYNIINSLRASGANNAQNTATPQTYTSYQSQGFPSASRQQGNPGFNNPLVYNIPTTPIYASGQTQVSPFVSSQQGPTGFNNPLSYNTVNSFRAAGANNPQSYNTATLQKYTADPSQGFPSASSQQANTGVNDPLFYNRPNAPIYVGGRTQTAPFVSSQQGPTGSNNPLSYNTVNSFRAAGANNPQSYNTATLQKYTADQSQGFPSASSLQGNTGVNDPLFYNRPTSPIYVGGQTQVPPFVSSQQGPTCSNNQKVYCNLNPGATCTYDPVSSQLFVQHHATSFTPDQQYNRPGHINLPTNQHRSPAFDKPSSPPGTLATVVEDSVPKGLTRQPTNWINYNQNMANVGSLAYHDDGNSPQRSSLVIRDTQSPSNADKRKLAKFGADLARDGIAELNNYANHRSANSDHSFGSHSDNPNVFRTAAQFVNKVQNSDSKELAKQGKKVVKGGISALNEEVNRGSNRQPDRYVGSPYTYNQNAIGRADPVSQGQNYGSDGWGRQLSKAAISALNDEVNRGSNRQPNSNQWPPNTYNPNTNGWAGQGTQSAHNQNPESYHGNQGYYVPPRNNQGYPSGGRWSNQNAVAPRADLVGIARSYTPEDLGRSGVSRLNDYMNNNGNAKPGHY